ncbi:hypothetical protein DID78_05730 [Candidatus Marinamargulisbacteria bacterium SCGC AG-343-D04]|nr:hypothetical protein DID78_05730 [Candidatus Marinamargulisbacteria bacterium SCGC AG-343-D04]
MVIILLRAKGGHLIMKPSHLLAEEIEQIYSMLDILEVMHEQLQNDQPVNLDDLSRIIHYFRVFVHICHNKKEQHIVFPELQKSGISMNMGIIKDMQSENQLAEFYIFALKKILKDVKKGDKVAEKKLKTMISKYLNLEKNHIQKEQLFVLPLCNQEISEEKQEKITAEFKLSDEYEFGSGMHHKFHEAFAKKIKSMQQHYCKKKSK